MINIKLSCSYQEFQLQLEQSIPSKQIIGLFGTSGSGKSNFIRQLLGFDKNHLNTGKIVFGNTTWLNTEQKISVATSSRGIGYQPQNLDLLPHLTVEQNIRFAIDKRPQIKLPVDLLDLLKQLDIEHLINRFPAQLSGGQKQRVSLARAIMAAEHLLVLDEPFSAQGETHKHQLMQFLKRLNRDHQITIIMASHDRFEHAFLSDYLLTFNHGKICQSGSYDDLATDISGRFAQTSDAVNHISARALSYHQDFYLNLLEAQQQQLWVGDQPIEANSEVLLEVRAKDISLSKLQDDQSSIVNSLRVTIAEFYEVERHQYLVKLAFGKSFITTFITKKSFIELAIQPGDQLFARFKSVSVLAIQLPQR